MELSSLWNYRTFGNGLRHPDFGPQWTIKKMNLKNNEFEKMKKTWRWNKIHTNSGEMWLSRKLPSIFRRFAGTDMQSTKRTIGRLGKVRNERLARGVVRGHIKRSESVSPTNLQRCPSIEKSFDGTEVSTTARNNQRRISKSIPWAHKSRRKRMQGANFPFRVSYGEREKEFADALCWGKSFQQIVKAIKTKYISQGFLWNLSWPPQILSDVLTKPKTQLKATRWKSRRQFTRFCWHIWYYHLLGALQNYVGHRWPKTLQNACDFQHSEIRILSGRASHDEFIIQFLKRQFSWNRALSWNCPHVRSVPLCWYVESVCVCRQYRFHLYSSLTHWWYTIKIQHVSEKLTAYSVVHQRITQSISKSENLL